MARTYPTRSPERLEQIRTAYERGAVPVRAIGTLFSLVNGEIHELVRRYGWAARSEMTPCERASAARTAEAARDRDLYGDAVDDVRLLRRRGFVVVREGDRYRVGNVLCTLAGLRTKAARERRLLEAQANAGDMAKPGRPKIGVNNTPIKDGAPALAETRRPAASLEVVAPAA